MKHSDVLKLLLPASYDPNGPNLAVELEAEGARLDQAQADAAQLLAEFFPETCLATLPEWEFVYGLPDPCLLDDAQSLSERRAALMAKVRAIGGLSLPYFRQMAVDLGYAGVTMGNYMPATCSGDCGMSLWDVEWLGAWYVNFPDATRHVIANCGDACEGALDVYKTGALECMINRLKPADTIVVFNYGG